MKRTRRRLRTRKSWEGNTTATPNAQTHLRNSSLSSMRSLTERDIFSKFSSFKSVFDGFSTRHFRRMLFAFCVCCGRDRNSSTDTQTKQRRRAMMGKNNSNQFRTEENFQIHAEREKDYGDPKEVCWNEEIDATLTFVVEKMKRKNGGNGLISQRSTKIHFFPSRRAKSKLSCASANAPSLRKLLTLCTVGSQTHGKRSQIFADPRF